MTNGKTSRSPAAPSRSLQDCFSVAALIYDSQGHTDFGAPEICSKANVSASSGSGKSLVSDLRQYGLTKRVAEGRYEISQEMKDAHALPKDSPEFRSIMWEFANAPKVFMAVIEDAKGKLPDEKALASTLRARYKFNAGKADVTAKALYETLSEIGVLDDKRNILEPRRADEGQSRREHYDEVDDEFGPAGYSPSGLMRPLKLDVPLTAGRIATIFYPADLTAEEAKKVCKVVTAACD